MPVAEPEAVKIESRIARYRKPLAIALLIVLFIPGLLLIFEELNACMIYSYTHNGVAHLLQVKAIFSSAQAHSTGLLDVKKLQLAQQEFVVAQSDFEQSVAMLQHDAAAGVAAQVWPQQLHSLEALAKIGIEVAACGQVLVKTAFVLAPTFRGPLLNDSQQPLVTPAMLVLMANTIQSLLPHLATIQTLSQSVSLNTLPISAEQRQQLTIVLQAIPQVRAELSQGTSLVDAVGWLLGVNEARTLLVQTMDRSELRPTGGFTGQFGELQISGGRIAPFTLKDIGPFEERNPTAPNMGKLAPMPYRLWWPIPNWGLRDSNLSADFPTSARLALDAYKYEFGHQVDGLILFSPVFIGRVLQITGPLTLPAYHETITAQNLEERLHYYQLDNDGIRKEEIVEHVDDPLQARKLFAAMLSRTLMDHVRHAPADEFIGLARETLTALKTKDVQLYVTNPQIEALLLDMGAAAAMDRSLTHDGLYVVQANVSASKASQYVRTIMHDEVTLDAQGGATHNLQLHLVYNQLGPVYGLDTYRDYIRVYVPPNSTFLAGDGFDSGQPFCGAGYGPCPLNDIYGNGDLLCADGVSRIGAGPATTMLNDPYAGLNHPLNKVGAPTNFVSDEAQRAMFSGWVVIPKNCSMTVTLSWHVPALSSGPYTLLVQRQSSTFPELDLTILPSAANCGTLNGAGKHIDLVMDGQDKSFECK